MSKELVISATPHETRVAIVEDGLLCEIYIEREKEFALVGSLYKGRVTRVLPGMQSAFVDIGLDSDAFLYVSDFLEHLEDYDHVEAKVQKPAQHAPQPPGEVFAPSTTNGGVVTEPGHDAVHEADVDSAPPVVSPEFAAAPAAEGVSSAGPNAPAQNAPSFQPTQRPFDKRPDRGGRSGPNDRGGRGGRNRRWGRQGGGHDRRPGRDLPPSKYASPRPFDSRPPRESQPYEPPPPGFEPVILPGESLAKYKDRIPAPPRRRAERPANASTVQAAPPVSNVAQDAAPETSAVALPDSLFASPFTTPYTSEPEIPAERESPFEIVEVVERVELIEEVVAAAPIEEPPAVPEVAYPKSVPEPEPQPEFAEAIEAHAPSAATLSDDEVTTLAEQLAEAKHEEAQAEADDLPEPQEAGAEPFVEEAELEELQDALNDDHEDDAAEADAVADEMHDEAMAAESDSSEEKCTGRNRRNRSDSSSTMEASDEETIQGEVPFSAEGALDPSEQQPHSDAPPTSARISEQPHARFQRPMRLGVRPQRGAEEVEEDAAGDAPTTSGLVRRKPNMGIRATSTIAVRN